MKPVRVLCTLKKFLVKRAGDRRALLVSGAASKLIPTLTAELGVKADSRYSLDLTTLIRPVIKQVDQITAHRLEHLRLFLVILLGLSMIFIL